MTWTSLLWNTHCDLTGFFYNFINFMKVPGQPHFPVSGEPLPSFPPRPFQSWFWWLQTRFCCVSPLVVTFSWKKILKNYDNSCQSCLIFQLCPTYSTKKTEFYIKKCYRKKPIPIFGPLYTHISSKLTITNITAQISVKKLSLKWSF